MNVEAEKIKRLVEIYGNDKNYPQKSHLRLFCEDHELNYIQWSAYCKGSQKLGLKIIYDLMNFFPKLNLNWLLKNDELIFVGEDNPELKEPETKYFKKNIGNEELYNKLDEILTEIKKVTVNN